ncbi:MAG TPA: response regulator [Sphingomicrobium sp.]|nr:response regulator [Sphingomicrobium sp.]
MDRFLVVAPAGRDADVIRQLLASGGLNAAIDATGDLLFDALRDGSAAGAVVTDDALKRLDHARLSEAIANQLPWSDFPFVLLVRRGGTRESPKAIEAVMNVTVLERPLHPASLISAARAATRARARQRLAAEYLAERERAERQLRDFADTLEQKVVERTRDLASANDRLTAEIAERERAEARLIQAQKMEAIGQLTGGIAHDFNNLLSVVVGSLDLVLRRSQDQGVLKLARNALKAAERGATLTAQLLTFSRRQRLSPVALDINHVIEGMREMAARTIGAHVQIETDLQPGMWRALADPTQLEVMLLNLAINSRDAMPSGGKVVIRTRNVPEVPRPLVSELDHGEYVCISVQDDGPGMPPDVLAHAFEPFFTTKSHGKGTGLGLAQLYGFAKQSGGAAKIESELGRGTMVSIYLPRTQDHVALEITARHDGPGGGRARILLVDDDEEVRTVTCDMIGELGYRIESVGTGEEALARIRLERFDLLITDILMPGMNGVELARRIRSLDADLPILFSSGYADVQIFGEELSDETVLKKPFRIAEAARRIKAALEAGVRSDAVLGAD